MGELFGDFADLGGGFAGGEDHFGMAAAQRAVVVEGGKRKLLKREGSEAGEGVGDGETAVGDVGKEILQLGRAHSGILGPGKE